MHFSSRAICKFLLPLLVLPWMSAPLMAQDEWKARDAWQKPQEVMDVLGIKPAAL